VWVVRVRLLLCEERVFMVELVLDICLSDVWRGDEYYLSERLF